MYFAGAKRYLRLLDNFSSHSRFWVELWLESLHVGTHIHWRLSPLSILGLARLWFFFRRLDRWEPQKAAIIRMLSRRRCGDYQGAMPVPESSATAWEEFLQQQMSSAPERLEKMLDWHQRLLENGDIDSFGQRKMWVALNELAALLSNIGYSTHDLFNRVKDGVIDVKKVQGGIGDERLLLFLDYFRSPEPRRYIVWTRVRVGREWSRTTAKRFALIRASRAQDIVFENRSILRVFLGEEERYIPHIMTEESGAFSVAERHRLRAIDEIEASMRQEPRLGNLSLDAETRMVLSDQRQRKPWLYGHRPYAIPMLSSRDPASKDTLRIGEAGQRMYDRPERVIDEVFRAWEYSGYRKYWRTIPSSYHRTLRADLGSSIISYCRRISGAFSKYGPQEIPAGIRLVSDSSIIDHGDLLEAIKTYGAEGGQVWQVLALRLKEIVEWNHFAPTIPLEEKSYNTVHEIADLLTLAKGVRNYLAHGSSIPFELYHKVLYLATVVLYAFSAVVRDGSAKGTCD